MLNGKSLSKFFRSNLAVIILLTIILIPTFWRMLRPGMFSTHDFHVFRQFEFNKCMQDLQIPCRWAPDATFEYGQPVFNFYGQLPYLLGQIPIFLGLQVMDGVKFSFILSLILSAVGMFYLSRKLWGNDRSAFISAMAYTYAPYRAVDVWVRGALPEALSFVFFPLLTLFFINFVESSKKIWILLFGITFSGLVITHNLSTFMYSIFLVFFGSYWIFVNRKFSAIFYFMIAGVLAVGLSAFYLLPVAMETKYISLESTTEGYYNFEHHYLSIRQLLLSNNWGYGGSTYGDDDGFNLSVGYLQWMLPVVTLALIILLKKIKKSSVFIILFALGWMMLLLTHAKSRVVWHIFPPLTYVQFPWRFLGSATFIFALASGYLVNLLPKKNGLIASVGITLTLIGLTVGFFQEDIWYPWSDKEYFSGENYRMQISSALTDFWPRFGDLVPMDYAPKAVLFENGEGLEELKDKSSNKVRASVKVSTTDAKVSLPVVYFPGWVIFEGETPLHTYPSGRYGLISTTLSQGDHNIEARLTNTPVRYWGNWISTVSLVAFLLLLWRFGKK